MRLKALAMGIIINKVCIHRLSVGDCNEGRNQPVKNLNYKLNS